MLFRLALALGRTIQELRATLSYREFLDWCLYYRIEPWGEPRADLRAGIIASTVANYAGKARPESAGPTRPVDFMPYADLNVEQISPVVEQKLTDDELAAWADAAVFGIPPE